MAALHSRQVTNLQQRQLAFDRTQAFVNDAAQPIAGSQNCFKTR